MNYSLFNRTLFDDQGNPHEISCRIADVVSLELEIKSIVPNASDDQIEGILGVVRRYMDLTIQDESPPITMTEREYQDYIQNEAAL